MRWQDSDARLRTISTAFKDSKHAVYVKELYDKHGEFSVVECVANDVTLSREFPMEDKWDIDWAGLRLMAQEFDDMVDKKVNPEGWAVPSV